MFENLEEKATNIKESSKVFIEKQVDYTKLKVFYHVTNGISKLVKGLLIGIPLLLALVFLSTGLSIALNEYLDHVFLGYLITGGIYIVFAIIFFALRDSIEKKIVEKSSNSFFRHEK